MKHIIATLVFVTVALTSCTPTIKTDNLALISKSTDNIRTLADNTVKLEPKTKPNMDSIKAETTNIDNSVKSTQDQITTLNQNHEKELLTLKKDRDFQAKNADKLATELAKEKAGNLKLLHTLISLTIFAGGIGIALSVWLMILGNLKALGTLALSVSAIAVGMFLNVALTYMIWIASATGVLLVGIIAYIAWEHRSNILVAKNSNPIVPENKI